MYMLYKAGDPSDPLNYRLISLLNTLYKIFTHLVNKRLSKYMERIEGFSTMQGGFRIGKTTHTKIWTLVQIIKHAKREKRPLHVCYIDVKEACDNIEHLGLEHVLERYCFNKKFIQLINAIYTNNKSDVITPYGPSDMLISHVG